MAAFFHQSSAAAAAACLLSVAVTAAVDYHGLDSVSHKYHGAETVVVLVS
jgi:hypothetical protein